MKTKKKPPSEPVAYMRLADTGERVSFSPSDIYGDVIFVLCRRPTHTEQVCVSRDELRPLNG